MSNLSWHGGIFSCHLLQRLALFILNVLVADDVRLKLANFIFCLSKLQAKLLRTVIVSLLASASLQVLRHCERINLLLLHFKLHLQVLYPLVPLHNQRAHRFNLFSLVLVIAAVLV